MASQLPTASWNIWESETARAPLAREHSGLPLTTMDRYHGPGHQHATRFYRSSAPVPPSNRVEGARDRLHAVAADQPHGWAGNI